MDTGFGQGIFVGFLNVTGMERAIIGTRILYCGPAVSPCKFNAGFNSGSGVYL